MSNLGCSYLCVQVLIFSWKRNVLRKMATRIPNLNLKIVQFPLKIVILEYRFIIFRDENDGEIVITILHVK